MSEPPPLPPRTPEAEGLEHSLPAGRESSTSGMAVMSLVLGLLGSVLFIISGLPAIILGHMSRSRIKKSEGALDGKGMALSGLIFGYLSIPWTIALVAAFMFVTQQIKRVNRSSGSYGQPTWGTFDASQVDGNAEFIFSACRRYAEEHDGNLPRGLYTLVDEDYLSEWRLHSPKPRSGRGFFELLAAGEKLAELPENEVIVRSRKMDDGNFVLIRAGGTVERVPE